MDTFDRIITSLAFTGLLVCAISLKYFIDKNAEDISKLEKRVLILETKAQFYVTH